MKLDIKTGSVQSNAAFDSTTKMTFDEASTSLIIRSLTNMYSEPYLAVLREYVSNAYDSHVLAGQTEKPIQVTRPTALNFNLTIRDYGVGMSRTELVEVYSKYGASTKRDSNEFIGAFGLGSKSALALVSQFTVISIKDGKKNTVIVAKNEEEAGELHFLDEVDTDEENGVTINIPIPDSSKLRHPDELFFAGFPSGTIEVDGHLIENSLDNTKMFQVYENGWWSENPINTNQYHNYASLKAFIGPVLYNLDLGSVLEEELNERNNDLVKFFYAYQVSNSLILNIPNGSVDLTPSREEIIYNTRSVEALRQNLKDFREEVLSSVQERANLLTDRKEFFSFLLKNHSIGFAKTLVFEDVEVAPELPFFKNLESIADATVSSFSPTRSNKSTIKGIHSAAYSGKDDPMPVLGVTYSSNSGDRHQAIDTANRVVQSLKNAAHSGIRYYVVVNAPKIEQPETPVVSASGETVTPIHNIARRYSRFVKETRKDMKSFLANYSNIVKIVTVSAPKEDLNPFFAEFATEIIEYDAVLEIIRKAERNSRSITPTVKKSTEFSSTMMGYGIPLFSKSAVKWKGVSKKLSEIPQDAKLVVLTDDYNYSTETASKLSHYILNVFCSGRRATDSATKFLKSVRVRNVNSSVEGLMNLFTYNGYTILTPAGKKYKNVVNALPADRVVTIEDALEDIFSSVKEVAGSETLLKALEQADNSGTYWSNSSWMKDIVSAGRLDEIESTDTQNYITDVRKLQGSFVNFFQSLKAAFWGNNIPEVITNRLGFLLNQDEIDTLINLFEKYDAYSKSENSTKDDYILLSSLRSSGKEEVVTEIINYINYKDSTR